MKWLTRENYLKLSQFYYKLLELFPDSFEFFSDIHYFGSFSFLYCIVYFLIWFFFFQNMSKKISIFELDFSICSSWTFFFNLNIFLVVLLNYPIPQNAIFAGNFKKVYHFFRPFWPIVLPCYIISGPIFPNTK